MSRNLCNGMVCANCGADFMPRTIPMDDPGLRTEEEYFREIEWWPNPYFGNLGHGWIHNERRALSRDPRFRRNDCPVCGCPHAGWYMAVMGEETTPVMELFDTSYWFAFNDEPSDADTEALRPVMTCIHCHGFGLVPVGSERPGSHEGSAK